MIQPRRRRRSGPLHRFRRRIRRVQWKKMLIVLVTVLVIGGMTFFALLVDSVNRVQSSINGFQRVVSSLSAQTETTITLADFERLNTSVHELVDSLNVLSPRLALVRLFSPFNSDLHVAVTSVDAAMHLAHAASDALRGLQPTLFFLVTGSDTQSVVAQISSGERIVELLNIGRPQFISAGERLALARTTMDTLNLAGASTNTVLTVQQLNGYLDQLTQITDVLLAAPDFLTGALGIAGEKNYLVLSQNNDELRPSGGYLSTYGWLTIRNGRVTNFGYNPTTATSPNPPAEDFLTQFAIPDWWLQYREPIYAAWDGSWYADFPSTAQMATAYYNGGENPQSPVDGAIAIDLTGFEYLLEAIGTITVPGYETPVSSENFREVVYDIRAYGEEALAHKQYIAAVYQEIFQQWQRAPLNADQNTLLLQAVLRALQEKHIMLYMSDPPLNNALQLLGWAGVQAQERGHDYLMVVDANLGNKSNHSIRRFLTYDVDIQDNATINGRLSIAYDYSARVAAEDPAVNPPFHGDADYNNLLQVFVPHGTTLNDAVNFPALPRTVSTETASEFVARLYIPFDTSPRFQLLYNTPPLIEQVGSYSRYRLLIQKQPGTHMDAVSVQITLPQDARFVSSTPEIVTSYTLERPILEFRTSLVSDRWIEVLYQD